MFNSIIRVSSERRESHQAVMLMAVVESCLPRSPA